MWNRSNENNKRLPNQPTRTTTRTKGNVVCIGCESIDGIARRFSIYDKTRMLVRDSKTNSRIPTSSKRKQARYQRRVVTDDLSYRARANHIPAVLVGWPKLQGDENPRQCLSLDRQTTIRHRWLCCYVTSGHRSTLAACHCF